jgi:hypothetical protein
MSIAENMDERGAAAIRPQPATRPGHGAIVMSKPRAAVVVRLVGVAGDSLSGFQGAVIFQKIRDASCPE